MGYKVFKVNVLSVLDSAYDSTQLKDKLRKFASDSEFKQLYGQRMVDRIVKRTQSGVDMNDKPMGKYKESEPKGHAYKNSFIFQVYGKRNKVDLTLTGEMLSSLTADFTKSLIIIDVDSENSGKAEGHITGKYGKNGRTDPRPFLGLPPAEVISLFKESMKDFRSGATAENEV